MRRTDFLDRHDFTVVSLTCFFLTPTSGLVRDMRIFGMQPRIQVVHYTT